MSNFKVVKDSYNLTTVLTSLTTISSAREKKNPQRFSQESDQGPSNYQLETLTIEPWLRSKASLHTTARLGASELDALPTVNGGYPGRSRRD